MADTQAEAATDLVGLSTEIVGAYVGHNSISPADLPGLIAAVHQTLSALQNQAVEPAVLPQEPAVLIRKSVRPDAITCLEEGKTFKSLKRHLQTHHHLTPQQYREKWKLPVDYPMVSPNYSVKRSELAKTNGLGRKPGSARKVSRRGASKT